MIRVLEDWREVGLSILSLQRNGLPLHTTAQKNWDHFILLGLASSLDHRCAVIDLGCHEGCTLAFLHAVGFEHLQGIDLSIGWRGRARQFLSMWRERTVRAPFHMRRADITNTRLAAESFDLALSISTIEHGVDGQAFLNEVNRLLKPGGLLFVTTDYWNEKTKVCSDLRAFGQRWTIFSREEIDHFLQLADSSGFRLLLEESIPACRDKPVFWNGVNYTFIAMAFRKLGTSL